MRRAPALACLAAAMSLAACGSKKEEPPGRGSAPAPAPTAGSAPAPAASGSAAAPSTPPPSAPASDAFPAACLEYRQTIERLAQCGDALPAGTRDDLRALFDRQWSGWEKLPEQDRRTLAEVCKSSADSVKAAASAACNW